MPWHDSLMPIDRNYTAVQRAVVECAYAGCETIWITLSYGQEPLVREMLGDFVEDPVWFYRFGEKYPKENRKQIPIFYVPIHPKDAGRRDCYSWGILNSAMASYYTSKKISNWLLPNKYYVSHPYGVYDPSIVRTHRKDISSIDKCFYMVYDGKTIADDYYLGFTFDTKTFVLVRRQFRELEKVRKRKEPRPARFFKIKDIFNVLDPQFVDCEETVLCQTSEYHDISFWNGYVNCVSSGTVKRPNIKILKEGNKKFALPPIQCYNSDIEKD
tara:strand:+ start:442 stop:1254 length:813 start_codon:yes stop_codon:yes gene_type:complete